MFGGGGAKKRLSLRRAASSVIQGQRVIKTMKSGINVANLRIITENEQQ